MNFQLPSTFWGVVTIVDSMAIGHQVWIPKATADSWVCSFLLVVSKPWVFGVVGRDVNILLTSLPRGSFSTWTMCWRHNQEYWFAFCIKHNKFFPWDYGFYLITSNSESYKEKDDLPSHQSKVKGSIEYQMGENVDDKNAFENLTF